MSIDPPKETDNFVDKISDNISHLYTNYPNAEIILLGDFNLNIRDTNSAEARHVKWLEQMTGLKQCITGIMRYSNTNSCIDLLFTNMSNNNTTNILDINISDQ